LSSCGLVPRNFGANDATYNDMCLCRIQTCLVDMMVEAQSDAEHKNAVATACRRARQGVFIDDESGRGRLGLARPPGRSATAVGRLARLAGGWGKLRLSQKGPKTGHKGQKRSKQVTPERPTQVNSTAYAGRTMAGGEAIERPPKRSRQGRGAIGAMHDVQTAGVKRGSASAGMARPTS